MSRLTPIPLPRVERAYARPLPPQDLRALWRARWLIVVAALVGAALAAGYARGIAVPTYRAAVSLMLLPEEPRVIDLESVLPALGRDAQVVNTQAEVLRSRVLVGRLVDTLELTRDAEFNPALRATAPAAPAALAAGLRERLEGWLGAPGPTAAAPPPDPRARTIEHVRAALDIAVAPETLVLTVAVTTRAPDKSARIANSLADLYLADQVALKLEANARATEWLSGRVADLQARLETAEARARSARAAQNLTSAEELTQMERRLEALRALRTAADATAERVALDMQIAALTEAVQRASRDQVTVRQLEREAEATRLLYGNFLSRLQETALQTGRHAPDARILSAATPPAAPAWPRTGALVVLGLIGGTGLGALAALARAQWGGRIASMDEAHRVTGLPVLAALPELPPRRTPLDALLRQPDGPLAEAVRDLRNSLLLAAPRPGAQVIALTGSVPGEGVSAAALTLAQLLSGWRKSVLLIEAAPAGRSILADFDAAERPGLLSVLAGVTDLDAALWRPEGAGMDVLVGERVSAAAADILSTDRLQRFLAEMRARYDYVLIDTPPVLARSEARLIAPLADAVVYAVRWKSTSIAQIRRGLVRFAGFGVPVTGVVLTRAAPRAARRAGD